MMDWFDGVQRRRIAGAVYVLLWALKGSQIFLAEPELAMGVSFLGMWCILDALFFLMLRVARVPWLQFSIKGTIILILAHWLLNAGVIGAKSEYQQVEVHWAPSKEKAFIGPAVQKHLIDADILNSSHIIGSHLVNVRAPTKARLNPDSSAYCLNDVQESLVVPLLIQGTPPWQIDYDFWGFDGSHFVKRNVTIDGSDAVNPAGREKKGPRTDRYPFKVDRLGVYRLLSIRETSGEGKLGEGRIIQKNITAVVACPEVRLDPADRDREIDRCVDDTHTFTINMKGTPPVVAWYLRRVGKVETLVSVTTVDGKWEGIPRFKEELPRDIHELLEKSARRETSSQVEVKVESSDAHLFRILQITDGYNNTVDYPTQVKIATPDKGANVIQMGDPGDALKIEGRPHPTARFRSCNNPKIRIGLEDDIGLPVEFQGSGDYNLEWTYGTSEHELNGTDIGAPKVIRGISSSQYDLPAKRAGVYTLRSVSDKYCAGTVEVPSVCSVQETYEPTINVTSMPIEEACVGTIGAAFDVSFTGEPPFWAQIVTENVERGTRAVERREIARGRDTIRFEPKTPGTYRYIFEKIGDANYRAGVLVKQAEGHPPKHFTQKIHPHSNAYFTGPLHITRCLNSTVELPVTLEGSGPWELNYEIMGGGEKRRISVEVRDQPNYTIKLPVFEKAGRYAVDLTDIKDRNRCTRVVQGQPVQIEILAQRPAAHFNCPRPVAFLEGGKAKLPVYVSGSGDFELSYKRKDSDEVYVASGHRRLDSIEVSSAGVYELTQIRDTYCVGSIATPKECEAVVIPKPELEIPPTEYVNKTAQALIRQPVCVNVPQIMEVHLSGRPPFKLKYSHGYQKHEHGRKSVDDNKVLSDYQDQSSQKFAKIKLITDRPGLHTYTFKSLSDDNYREVLFPTGRIPPVQQRVYAHPDAVFLDEAERTIQCIHNASDTSIRIKLTGQAPFNLQLYTKHDSHPAELTNLVIQASELSKDGVYTYRPTAATETGRHQYYLQHVRDTTGCDAILDGYLNPKPTTKIAIQVADVARILPLGPDAVCVGDMLTYSLQGTPPFKVQYRWNGEEGEVEVADPMLSLFAGEAGEAEIVNVCNGLGCCHKPEREVRSLVRELPKAFVDEGTDYIDEIREGDNSEWSVRFEGTPPFSFTWSRTSLEADGKQRKKSRQHLDPEEAQTVTDIENFTYRLTTSQEGLFRVISVHDKYCGYPRAIQNVAAANAVLKKAKK
ncbi:hypothetical protein HDV00_001114 [Rhizophlyctis rosea]|nr:hypothetical protein HDV00_001114 [Rhizophlyctis rosea]